MLYLSTFRRKHTSRASDDDDVKNCVNVSPIWIPVTDVMSCRADRTTGLNLSGMQRKTTDDRLPTTECLECEPVGRRHARDGNATATRRDRSMSCRRRLRTTQAHDETEMRAPCAGQIGDRD